MTTLEKNSMHNPMQMTTMQMTPMQMTPMQIIIAKITQKNVFLFFYSFLLFISFRKKGKEFIQDL